MPDTTDPVALDGIRERATLAAPALAARRGLNSMADSAEDVPRLLGAVDAALASHVEAVIEDMPEPRFRYCSTCSGHPAWPCPEVAGYGHDDDKGPLDIRLWRQLIVDPGGCLLWQGEIGWDGYGRIKIDGRKHPVHRVVYELWVEPIPDGMEIDHVKKLGCRNRHCAAPSHLEPVTGLENKLRAGGIIAAHVAATHCGTCGEPYDEKNTYRTAEGRRGCRNCRRESSRRYREQRKAS